ncbi:unnamed protein product [Blepharisma stoltei]|uniref:Tetratricopeptide repeat protein n=1 Tax=Blepharisma stoltei TaxID=1481888 RepID=A0AAU9K2Q8_9CILI|nr:unnamed protein product [Blepharisma stoltei]
MQLLTLKKGNLEAIECYRKAIKICPDWADIYNNLGNALDELGKYPMAIESFNKAIELEPENPSFYNNRGLALKGQGKYLKAIKWFDKAIQVKPDYF